MWSSSPFHMAMQPHTPVKQHHLITATSAAKGDGDRGPRDSILVNRRLVLDLTKGHVARDRGQGLPSSREMITL